MRAAIAALAGCLLVTGCQLTSGHPTTTAAAAVELRRPRVWTATPSTRPMLTGGGFGCG